ncbi:MAG: hypothetical protein HEQ22_03255 [Sphingopyxis sp.]|uniref:hypothetical protein n=1 Tax=Sphingopyxis sp. TaxID=1908224 RepID=UPI003D80F6B1
MTRWLAIYSDNDGNSRATMITAKDRFSMPFGFDGAAVPLPDFNPGGPLTLVEMPADPEFRPMIVDCDNDEEAALNFIDL